MSLPLTDDFTSEKVHFSKAARQLGLSVQELMRLEAEGKIAAPESYSKGEGRYYTQVELIRIADQLQTQKGSASSLNDDGKIPWFIFLTLLLILGLAYWLLVSESEPVLQTEKIAIDQPSKRVAPSGPKPKWLNSKFKQSIQTETNIQSETSRKLQEQQSKGVSF